MCLRLDRASRWAHFKILPNKTAEGTRVFLGRLAENCPCRITKIIADNGKEFLPPLHRAGRARADWQPPVRPGLPSHPRSTA
jgi:hypothetical protein